MVISNTHILVPEFEYLEPETLDEVLAELSHDSARPLAGGTDLIVQMKMERQRPARLVSLARVPGLSDLAQARGLTIGAMTSIRAIARSEAVQRDYAALADACRAFSTIQIMSMATLGGNLCNASPAADTAPPLLAYDALVDVASIAGRRTLSLEALFVGPGQTSLRTDELLVAVRLGPNARGSASAFVKVGRVAADISKVCAAVRLVREDDRVVECAIALGSVAPTPIRARGAESHLTGQPLDPNRVEEAAQLAAEDSSPISDVRSTDWYRRQVTSVVVRDALASAWSRGGGGDLS